MVLSAAQRAFRRHRYGSLNIVAADIETLIVEAIFRCPELETMIDIDWVADRGTARKVGWAIVKYPGVLFQIGRRLLQLATPDGYPMPPVEFRLCRDTEPPVEEEYSAPYLHQWSLILFSSGSRPAQWQLSGRVYHREWECETRIFWLLYLHREKKMARSTDGWLKLGKRFAT